MGAKGIAMMKITPEIKTVTAERAPLGYLPHAYRRRMPIDTDEAERLWARLRGGKDRDARQALIERYLPIALIQAWKAKRRNPEFYFDELDVLVSDGTLGVIGAVDFYAAGTNKWDTPGGKREYIAYRVRRAMREQVAYRHGLGVRGDANARVVRKTRAAFRKEHLREPSRAELLRDLRAFFKNPDMVIDLPADLSSEHQPITREMAVYLKDDRVPHVDDRLLADEAMRIAGKGLDAIEKKILRLALGGFNCREIGQRVGRCTGSVFARLNGIFWQLRCSAQLAQFLGVEARTEPVPRNRQRHVLTFNPLPAARLAV
jgi:DNA-directed RNA polymerase specialized sigma subunit